MKSSGKKFLTLLMAVFFILCLYTNVSASQKKDLITDLEFSGLTLVGNGIEDESHDNGNHSVSKSTDGDVSTESYAVCCGLPYHDLVSRGWADVYIGTFPDTSNLVMHYACCWQCSNCHMVFASQGDPTLGQPIGKYAMSAFYEPILYYGCSMWVSRTYYTSSTTLSGYHFR